MELDPNNVWPLQNLGYNYEMTRNFTAALQTVDRALKLDPDSFMLWTLKGEWALEAGADPKVISDAFAHFQAIPVPPEKREQVTHARVQFLIMQRRFLDALNETLKLGDAEVAKLGDPEALVSRYLMEGALRQRLQQEDEAQAALLRAKAEAERYVAAAPNEAKRHVKLAHVLAFLGEKEAAIAEGRRAVELRPQSLDAFDGPMMTQGLAEVHAILGDGDEAIDLLDDLLQRPSSMSVGRLQGSPDWDNLRDLPRFHALLDKYGAKA